MRTDVMPEDKNNSYLSVYFQLSFPKNIKASKKYTYYEQISSHQMLQLHVFSDQKLTKQIFGPFFKHTQMYVANVRLNFQKVRNIPVNCHEQMRPQICTYCLHFFLFHNRVAVDHSLFARQHNAWWVTQCRCGTWNMWANCCRTSHILNKLIVYFVICKYDCTVQ